MENQDIISLLVKLGADVDAVDAAGEVDCTLRICDAHLKWAPQASALGTALKHLKEDSGTCFFCDVYI